MKIKKQCFSILISSKRTSKHTAGFHVAIRQELLDLEILLNMNVFDKFWKLFAFYSQKLFCLLKLPYFIAFHAIVIAFIDQNAICFEKKIINHKKFLWQLQQASAVTLAKIQDGLVSNGSMSSWWTYLSKS